MERVFTLKNLLQSTRFRSTTEASMFHMDATHVALATAVVGLLTGIVGLATGTVALRTAVANEHSKNSWCDSSSILW
jgi:Na+/glutamate symporter